MDSNPYTASHDFALPRVLKMNGCFDGTNQKTVPWHEDIMGKGVCVKYTDCPAAYPVVFCTTVGDIQTGLSDSSRSPLVHGLLRRGERAA